MWQLSELRSKDVPPFTIKEREQLAASSDNVVNQRKKRLSSKLQDDVLSLLLKPY